MVSQLHQPGLWTMTKKKRPRKTTQRRPLGYLVATFEKFPGVEVPLLSDDECREHGVQPGKLPPFDTWSPEQQAALHELAAILAQMAVDEIIRD